jgi:MFS family permease
MKPVARLERLRSGPRYPQLLLITCLTGMFATTFTSTILTVSVKVVAADLHSTPQVIAWAITTPLLAQAVAMPFLGKLGDIKGHRRIYLLGFTVATAFSLLTALAWDAGSLIVFRTVAQLAGTATIPASLAMLYKAFPEDRRAQASAWASGTFSGASVTGLVIGGVLIDWIGWRPIFLAQAVLCALALLAAVLVLARDRPRTDHQRLDLVGAILLGAFAFCLAFGINRAATWGMRPVVIALLAATPLTLWALVAWERRCSHPLLPLALLRHRNMRAAGTTTFFINGCQMTSFLVTPLLLQSVMGMSAATTSLVTLARTLSISVSAPAAGRAGMRYGVRIVSIAGCAVMMGAAGMLALGARWEALAVVVIAMVLSGVAFGHVQPSLLTMAGNSVGDTDYGLATSLQQTCGQLGSVSGLSLATALIGSATVASQFTSAYLAAAVLAGVAAVCAVGAARHGEAVLHAATHDEDPDFLVAEAELDERLAEA